MSLSYNRICQLAVAVGLRENRDDVAKTPEEVAAWDEMVGEFESMPPGVVWDVPNEHAAYDPMFSLYNNWDPATGTFTDGTAPPAAPSAADEGADQ